MQSCPRTLLVVLSVGLLAALAGGCSKDPKASLRIQTPLGNQSGNVVITFTVAHRSADNVNLEVIYSTNGGAKFRPAAVVDADSSTKGLSTSKNGVEHTIEWDTVADGVALICPENQVRVHILPVTKAEDGRPDVTSDFTVNNGASSAPQTTFVNPVGVQSGDITIQYSLADPESDPASVKVEFSTDGGASFAPALPTPFSEGTTDLATNAGGMNHSFTWDSVTNTGFAVFTSVRIRILASDGSAAGQCEQPSETENFRLDNTLIVPRLYVTNPGSPDLAEVDTNTGAVRVVNAGAASPHSAIAVKQAAKTFLMVTDTAAGTVLVIDLELNTVQTAILVESAPKGIALATIDDGAGNLSRKAYVVNSGSDSVSIIDAETFTWIDDRPLGLPGSEPRDITASAIAGITFLYISLFAIDAVIPIDEFGDPVLLNPIPLNGSGPGPIAAVEGIAGSYVYVGNTATSSVSVIDTATDSVIGFALDRVSFPVPAGITSFAVPGGRTLALVSCSGDGTLRVVDVDGGHSLFATLPRAAQDPSGIVALPTHFGSRAYLVDSATGELDQIDLDLLESTGFDFPLPPITGLGPGILNITSSR